MATYIYPEMHNDHIQTDMECEVVYYKLTLFKMISS